MLQDIDQQLNEFYKRNLAAHGRGAQGVGWKNEEAQELRFQQLRKLLSTDKEFSINDLGCGTGAFFDFLKKQFPTFNYTGYDLMPDMIKICEETHRTPNCSFKHIRNSAEMEIADYSVASGIFNIRYSLTDQEWQSYILETLGLMNERSRIGFSFNALTIYSDPQFMKAELYYSDPLFLFDYCKRNFAKNVALLHDYYQYDFTIIVRK